MHVCTRVRKCIHMCVFAHFFLHRLSFVRFAATLVVILNQSLLVPNSPRTPLTWATPPPPPSPQRPDGPPAAGLRPGDGGPHAAGHRAGRPPGAARARPARQPPSGAAGVRRAADAAAPRPWPRGGAVWPPVRAPGWGLMTNSWVAVAGMCMYVCVHMYVCVYVCLCMYIIQYTIYVCLCIYIVQ